MRLEKFAGSLLVVISLTGCSASSNQLSVAGQQVRFVVNQPGKACHFLATLTGEQSNWISGRQSTVGSPLRGAANDLRNRAAVLGGNVIYNASTPAETLAASFIPLPTKMSGQVYRCP